MTEIPNTPAASGWPSFPGATHNSISSEVDMFGALEHSDLELVSSFDIRISGLRGSMGPARGHSAWRVL
jgi:hypothetical protein